MARNGSGDAWQALDDPFETEDEDVCPLCMEDIDVSDLNFRPCPCGYRICRFCWHHIKEDLNKRCPGCRKEYDDSLVEFKPMKPDELKRLQQAKKQREKQRKDLELMNRKHLANVRVKQKNQVHIQGLTTKMANEDTLAQLKSNELFTQYGRIQKMFMSRRAGPTNLFTPDARYQQVNLYINYSKNTEALACIAGLDGKVLPDGHRIKASLGSTKYCSAFLRGMKCNNDNCTSAHEMAEEVESAGSAAREEMSTARHAQKESEHRSVARSNSSAGFAGPSAAAALPPSASWAHRPPHASSSGSQPSSPAAHISPLPMPVAPPLAKQLSGRQQPKTHPLPPKPRHDSFSSTASTPTHPLPPNPIAAAAASSKAPTVSEGTQRTPPEPAPPVAPEEAPLQPPDTALPTEAAPDPASSTEATGPPVDLPVLPSTVPPQAAIAPPPGLALPSASQVPSLPPGLPVPASDSASSSPKPARTPSLPPGLFPDAEPDLCAISSPGSFAFNLGAIAQDVKGKGKQLGDSLDFDAISPFSSTFTTTLSLSDPIGGDLSSGLLSRTASLSGSALLAPLNSSHYYGSFDPFSDSDSRGNELSGTPPVADETRNRGSRFGFAKRDSMGSFAFGGDSPSSSLRSSLHGLPGLERTDSNRPSSSAGQGRIVSASSVAAAAATKTAEPGSSTPDASVLFPGVNLAASYSANAMPAAMAARGLKSTSLAPRQGGFPSPVTEAPGFPSRLGGNFPQSSGSPGYGSPMHAEQSVASFGGSSSYHDPAILNMRMASNGAPYGPPGLGGPEINGYAHYPLSGFVRNPFEPSQQQQQYGMVAPAHHHPALARQQSYFAGAGSAGVGSLQRGIPFFVHEPHPFGPSTPGSIGQPRRFPSRPRVPASPTTLSRRIETPAKFERPENTSAAVRMGEAGDTFGFAGEEAVFHGLPIPHPRPTDLPSASPGRTVSPQKLPTEEDFPSLPVSVRPAAAAPSPAIPRLRPIITKPSLEVKPKETPATPVTPASVTTFHSAVEIKDSASPATPAQEFAETSTVLSKTIAPLENPVPAAATKVSPAQAHRVLRIPLKTAKPPEVAERGSVSMSRGASSSSSAPGPSAPATPGPSTPTSTTVELDAVKGATSRRPSTTSMVSTGSGSKPAEVEAEAIIGRKARKPKIKAPVLKKPRPQQQHAAKAAESNVEKAPPLPQPSAEAIAEAGQSSSKDENAAPLRDIFSSLGISTAHPFLDVKCNPEDILPSSSEDPTQYLASAQQVLNGFSVKDMLSADSLQKFANAIDAISLSVVSTLEKQQDLPLWDTDLDTNDADAWATGRTELTHRLDWIKLTAERMEAFVHGITEVERLAQPWARFNEYEPPEPPSVSREQGAAAPVWQIAREADDAVRNAKMVGRRLQAVAVRNRKAFGLE